MKQINVLRDQVVVGVLSKVENPAFLASSNDSTTAGEVLGVGPDVKDRFIEGDIVFFGKDRIEIIVEGVLVKFMPESNIKARKFNV